MDQYTEMDTEDSGFDLHKLIRSAPVLAGRGLWCFSAIMDSILGWPLHWYLAKLNLEPIAKAGLDDEPTFYPIQPPSKDKFTSDDKNILDIEWQRKFLEDNTMSSAHYHSILDYHKAFMSSEHVTPEELVDRIQKKIEESETYDPPLRCFTQLNWQLAKQAAAESTIRYQNNCPLSVLDGVPIGIKDELNIKGFRTNCGRKKDMPVNEEDCATVAALRSLGVVIIGVTNMHEMGMGITGINPNKGTARNPHNDQHVTGGSSSGSAAAVSSGIVPFALGTDGGGSVRIPTSFCGMQGMKPTFGRVNASNTSLDTSTVTSIGVIANNVADVALVMNLMFIKASDQRFFNPGCFNPVRSLSDKPLSELKFGTNTEYVSYCHKEIQSVFETIVKPKLSKIVEIEFRELYMSKIAHMNIILSETSQNQQVWRDHYDTLTYQTKIIFSTCKRLALDHYMQSSAQKTRAIRMFKSIFEEVDLIITPTTACLPKRINPNSLTVGELDEENVLKTMWFVYLANFCGLPAMSINAGYTPSGLPVGLMLTAPWWREDLLISAAKHLETELKKPSRFYCPDSQKMA